MNISLNCPHTPPCGFTDSFLKRRFWCESEEDVEDALLKDKWIQNQYQRGEKGWLNPNTSKAKGIRITPEHTPFPESRKQLSRAVKKDPSFNYKEGRNFP
jgi:hypothetical protein